MTLAPLVLTRWCADCPVLRELSLGRVEHETHGRLRRKFAIESRDQRLAAEPEASQGRLNDILAA